MNLKMIELMKQADLLPRGVLTLGKRVDAVYMHVPFCFHKCHYCDFYSIVEDTGLGRDRRGEFTDRLIGEMKLRGKRVAMAPRTIFVGGGTPTLLRPELWKKLLGAMKEVGVLEGVEEFTVEANPETVTAELMAVLAEGGVNRVSIGAQSFDPAALKMLERWHEPANVGLAVESARRAGIGAVNIDLIFATPGQTMGVLESDLDRALELRPEHLSCYCLTYEPGTAMTQRLKMGQVEKATEEVERAMYERVMEKLEGAGYEQYEVSNWARRGRAGDRGSAGRMMGVDELGRVVPGSKAAVGNRCLHNLIYWSNGNWLGLGPGAASHVDGHRWKNQAHLGRYLDAAVEPAVVDYEHLPEDQRVGEELMLMLRLREGAPLGWLEKRLGGDAKRLRVIEEMIAIGMFERGDGRLRLSVRGLFVADAVLAELL